MQESGMASESSVRRKSRMSSSYDTNSINPYQHFEEMNNKELMKTVENETKISRNMFLENEIFEKYLQRAEPLTLFNLAQMMMSEASREAYQQRMSNVTSSRMGSVTLSVAPSQMSMATQPGQELISSMSVTSAEKPSGSKLLTNVASTIRTMMMNAMPVKETGPSINTPHKFDLCAREMEELRLSYEKLKRVYKVRKDHLLAHIEEISTMVGEVANASEVFNQNVIIDGVEELTKKIPSEVFVRFMEEWFRQAERLSGQLRLKTNTYKANYKKLSHQMQEKMELGESLSPVDFEFQEIRMLETSKQLKAKLLDLNLLKKDTANTHREFVIYKDRLAQQVAELKNLKAKTEEEERLLDEMDIENEIVYNEVEVAEKALSKIQETREMFTVPDVLEYATAKERVFKLRRELKAWNRRASLQHKQLVSVKQKMHRFKKELLY